MTRRCASTLAALALAGCSSTSPPSPPVPLQGVVSLDYCADQMVLGLVPRADIRGISPEADSDASFSTPRARGIARVRPSLEEIAALRPRYAVRMYGGAPGIDRQLAALGITVIQLNFATKLADIAPELQRVGAALDAAPHAARLRQDFLAKVAAAQRTVPNRPPSLLYITPGDVTTGPDSLVGEVIRAAGFRPIRKETGWGSIPVEAMVRRPPDAALRAFFDSPRYRQDRWSSSAHPRLQQLLAGVPTATVPGSALGCGNWLAGDAIAALTRLRQNIDTPS